jgi:tRNA threonylcarbamoyladenosine modification (KEOPS) complex  Pcc1 subunit
MHRAAIELRYRPPIALAVEGALSPESTSEVPKTSGRTTRTGETVRVELTAEDLSSLRAALNSYLRWADAAERAAKLGNG